MKKIFLSPDGIMIIALYIMFALGHTMGWIGL